MVAYLELQPVQVVLHSLLAAVEVTYLTIQEHSQANPKTLSLQIQQMQRHQDQAFSAQNFKVNLYQSVRTYQRPIVQPLNLNRLRVWV